MDNFIDKNRLMRTGGLTDYRGDKAANSYQEAMEETSRIRTEYITPRLIPFNGFLTNVLLAALPGADFARLLPHLEPVALLPNQDMYKFGEGIDFVYFPETAVISHLYFLEDGSTAGTTIIGREGMIGLSTIFDTRPPTYLTQVTIGGSALRADAKVIRQEFLSGGALQQSLLRYTNARLAQLSQRAVCNGRHKLDERLCTWLLMIHDRAGDEPLRLTHEEISHHLGARRAGISTYCNDLRDSGALDYRRGIIRIPDRQKLEAAACECYQTLKQTFNKSSN